MKYSVNYYSKGKRDFRESHIQVPKIFETTAIKENNKSYAGTSAHERMKNDFVVPWQMP